MADISIAEPAVKYKNNYLTQVIFRIDYNKMETIDFEDAGEKFYNLIKDDFPKKTVNKQNNVEISDTPKGFSYTTNTETIFKYSSNNQKITIELSNSFLNIVTLSYSDFQDFVDVIKKVLISHSQIFELALVNRIGLRYINQIILKDGHPFHWNGYINSNLCAVISQFVKPDDCVLRSMHNLELKVNGYQLRFKFGNFNSEYPNQIVRKEFVLDFDCYLVEEIQFNDIGQKVIDFNKTISKLFENSIDSKLRETMEVLSYGDHNTEE